MKIKNLRQGRNRLGRKKSKIKNGFTMVELMVAMGLFVILMGIATAGFVRSLRTQKDLVELMAVNDNAGLALEQMSREFRTGYNFSKVSETEIQFVNANNLIVFYRLNGGAIERGEEDALLNKTYKKITTDNVKINDFKIGLIGNLAGDGYPPRITIGISVSGTGRDTKDVFTNIQTTVSSRTLDT